MKYSNIRAFEKHLEGASPDHFSNVYMILAKESFERKMAADKVVASLLKGQSNPELHLKIFEGPHLILKDFIQELNGFSLFSGRTVILLQNADKLLQEARQAIEAYVISPSRSVFLIITAGSINHSTNLYKKTEKEGIVLEVPEEKPWEREKTLAEWVNIQVAANGKTIDPHACMHLVKHTGLDSALLHSEMEKLFCYIDERKTITLEDVTTICSNVNIESIWKLGEAIFRRDAGSALCIGRTLASDDNALLGLLRGLRSQFQTGYQVCSILAGGGTSQDITQRFPYMKGTILEKNIRSSQGYGMAKFKRGIQRIDEAEVMAKNSVSDEDVLLETLIVKLSAGV